MTEQILILRPTVIGGARIKNDFCVCLDGRSIGRIRQADNHVLHITEWRWQINPPLPIPTWAGGEAATLAAAKAAFRAAWERFYTALRPQDIAHWHQAADAAAARWGG